MINSEMTEKEMRDIQRRMKTCYGGKLIAHAFVDMTTLCAELTHIKAENAKLREQVHVYKEKFEHLEGVIGNALC